MDNEELQWMLEEAQEASYEWQRKFRAMRISRDEERSRADKNANTLARAIKAEQATSRVRELRQDYVIPESVQILIDRALDGETNG